MWIKRTFWDVLAIWMSFSSVLTDLDMNTFSLHLYCSLAILLCTNLSLWSLFSRFSMEAKDVINCLIFAFSLVSFSDDIMHLFTADLRFKYRKRAQGEMLAQNSRLPHSVTP